jgi:Na+/H+ antiporter NhaC
MHDYGIWTVITPLVTIFLAIFTRQVILSLLAGIVVGFIVIHHSLLGGIGATLNGIIETFASPGNARTVIFMVMIGGIMRLIVVTGGVRRLVQFLTENDYITSKRSVQLLAMIVTALIFIESSINQLIAGASSKDLARRYRGAGKDVLHHSDVLRIRLFLCHDQRLGCGDDGSYRCSNSQRLYHRRTVRNFASSMVWNIMAWLSLASVLFYILSGFSWGPMKKRRSALRKISTSRKILNRADEDIIDHPACNSLWNFFIPILSTVLMVPIALYVTGDGQFSKGSGSMSVYSGVMFGTVVSFIWFALRGILNVENFFKEIYIGYASMVKISSIMVLAFLMGQVSADLNTGQYIAAVTSGVIPGGVAIGFIFLISAVMSLATGTSWGTFAIMIPIGVQLGVSVGIPVEYMIGAAIAGSIFGDMTSPISSDAIVASMATNCEHIEHIRTQFPMR